MTVREQVFLDYSYGSIQFETAKELLKPPCFWCGARVYSNAFGTIGNQLCKECLLEAKAD